MVQKPFLKFASVSERPFWQRREKLALPSSVIGDSQGDTGLVEETINNETVGSRKVIRYKVQ